MPPIVLPAARLVALGKHWNAADAELPKTHGELVGKLCDETVGSALAQMLGGIPIKKPKMNSLLPPEPDCVEVGPTRVIGGIRPQNFDVAYRPDGIRFAYDSKTLNGRESVGKNYQNMVNDLGAEATTVHARFASAIVAFIIAVPEPCLGSHGRNLIAALTRLCGRNTTSGDLYKAEAIGLVVWHPDTGGIDAKWPPADSLLRIEKFSQQVESCYSYRFAGQPPHNTD
ncbi:MAG: hypothetical protein HYY24_03420 [Verrucomicrobia bacterium]|nr:hypothetical protein [Verrucomicrobiota bacterium]